MQPSVQESRGACLARRARSIPIVCVAFVLVTVLLPLLLVVALLVDLVRWLSGRAPFVAVRLVLMAWCFLVGDLVGLLAFAGQWLAAGCGHRRAWLTERTWGLQRAWTAWMFGSVRRLFGLTVVVEGVEHAPPGPVLVLIRHASIVDNLLPANLVARPAGLRLRYVLKRELLVEPCIDVAGQRLPNCFVRRDSGDPGEVARVTALATGLGPHEGALIYPEGTRFTPERRARGLARIAETDPERAQRLEALTHLLPPRTGGPIALLAGAPEADVLVCGHHGFDGLRLVSDVWRGGLVGSTIRVRCTRIPRADVPTERDAQVRWLDDVWLDMDRWVAAA